MIEKKDLFPLAIGTYGLGAPRYEAWQDATDTQYDDTEDLQALLKAFSLGFNFIETSYIYAGGQTIKFLGKFFKQVPREKIFVTVKIEKFVEKKEDIETQIDAYLSLMGLDYADSILLHVPAGTKLSLEETYAEMKRLVEKGKSRYLSGSNLSIDQLRHLVERNHFDLFSLEGLYNLECKANEDVGILDFCRSHDIVFACYQSLRRNRTAARNYPLLVELAQKYGKTQNQIILNWIVKEKGLMPLVKAGNATHLEENIASLHFDMDREDYSRLNTWRSEEFDQLSIDWDDAGGIPIYKLANQLP